MNDEPLTDGSASAEEWRRSLDLEEQEVFDAAKRCGLVWTPWMGDWFTSWSPRNSNSNAEGTWDHWVDFALRILSDPLTKTVRPSAYMEADQAGVRGFYSESDRCLTDEELRERFGSGVSS